MSGSHTKYYLNAECMAAFSKIISKELVGLHISSAGRSIGTMLAVKFGDLRAVPAPGLVGGTKLHDHGEWDLIVERGAWIVTHSNSHLASHESMVGNIDRVLCGLMGKTVAKFSIAASGRIEVSLVDWDGKLVIEPSGAVAGSLSQWVIFRREIWSVALEGDGAYVLEA